MARGKREGKVTQKAMVQAALDEKGWDAGPLELLPIIKDKFGVELPANVISNYKSVLSSPWRESLRRETRPQNRVQFSDLEAVRGLVTRLGAEQVKKLVEVATMFA